MDEEKDYPTKPLTQSELFLEDDDEDKDGPGLFQKVDSEVKIQEQTENVPVDKGNLVYLTFLLYGIGVILPITVVMACLDFYFLTMPAY